MAKKSNKTDYVLRLLTSGSDAPVKSNPILNSEFKDDVIHVKNIKEEQPIEVEIQPAIREVNVIAELVDSNILDVLNRFKCCSCEECVAKLKLDVLNSMKPQYICIKDEEKDRLEELKDTYKPSVISELIKNVIILKKNPPH